MKTCNSCGKCCIKYANAGLSASQDDQKLWETWQPDINRYARDGKIWMHPETGEQLEHCPWLHKENDQAPYTCSIYANRPEDCRVYPATVQDMLKDDCEMIEAKDRANLKLAQIRLEQIRL